MISTIVVFVVLGSPSSVESVEQTKPPIVQSLEKRGAQINSVHRDLIEIKRLIKKLKKKGQKNDRL